MHNIFTKSEDDFQISLSENFAELKRHFLNEVKIDLAKFFEILSQHKIKRKKFSVCAGDFETFEAKRREKVLCTTFVIFAKFELKINFIGQKQTLIDFDWYFVA